MKYILRFKEISKNDSAIAGGKGASLGEMTQAGIPVPPGFVVLADAFERFIEETDINVEIDTILHSVDHQKMHTVEDASEKIQTLIKSVKMPRDLSQEISSEFKKLKAPYVAVRSSATAEDSASAAWAGQLDTFLNTTSKTLLTNVQNCWASLFTPRAIFYRFEQQLHKHKISVAVVVQKMVQSETSGVAFSVHPVTEDRNQIIIEGSYGLGEAIVSGQVTPDSYVVEKNPRRIVDKNIYTQERGLFRGVSGGVEWKNIPVKKAESQVLTNKQIEKLSEEIISIENHYGFPCDIEWAIEKGKIYITQSRPITTLSLEVEEIKKSKKNVDNTSNFSTILSTVNRHTWRKDWEGNFNVFLCIVSSTPFYHEFQKKLGTNIKNIITTHRAGVGTCLISKEDEAEFANVLVKKVKKNPKLIKTWSDHVKKDYDELKKFLPLRPKVILKEETLLELIKYIRSFTAYLGGIKYVVNFLEKDFLDKYGKPMFEAREYTEKVFPELEDLTNTVFKYIGKQEKYSKSALSAVTVGELLDYVNGKGLPTEEILKQRNVLSAFLYNKDLTEITGNDVKELEDIIYGEKSSILTGNGVYPGKVQGKARVIVDFKKQKDSFGKGDILVTGMTDPNFVPLMKQAKAIITDGGGMLSHAAIVARELKVPCIIGTEKATRSIKDGDIVEVDADNGAVKIL